MTEAVAAAAALPRPRAGLRSTSRGRRMPEESSINAPDIGSQNRRPPRRIGARMKASRLALCRHIEIGPPCVIAMKAQASIRSRSKRHASMKS